MFSSHACSAVHIAGAIAVVQTGTGASNATVFVAGGQTDAAGAAKLTAVVDIFHL